MTRKTFEPDAIDYAEAAHHINCLTPASQLRFKSTMKILQAVKVAYIEGENTSFSRERFQQAKSTAHRYFTE